jgi:hypothetical protein
VLALTYCISVSVSRSRSKVQYIPRSPVTRNLAETLADSSFSLILGMSSIFSVPFQPRKNSELSHMNNPLFRGPLVLSEEGGLVPRRIRCFSIVSNDRTATLQAKDTDKTAAKSMFTDISHSVRRRVASKRAERIRYAVRRNDGRMVLTCSACIIGIMLHATQTLIVATAMERRVLRSLVDAVSASSAICDTARAHDDIYWSISSLNANVQD